MGITTLACTNATNWCDGVSSVINQEAPTDWTMLPIVDARLAIQIARKTGKEKGENEEGEGAGNRGMGPD
jgi:hypothetical protein